MPTHNSPMVKVKIKLSPEGKQYDDCFLRCQEAIVEVPAKYWDAALIEKKEHLSAESWNMAFEHKSLPKLNALLAFIQTDIKRFTDLKVVPTLERLRN